MVGWVDEKLALEIVHKIKVENDNKIIVLSFLSIVKS